MIPDGLAVRQDHFMERLLAVRMRPVMSTIGAGDALLSAFAHGYGATGDPYTALRKAMLFASYKIGEASAAAALAALTESVARLEAAAGSADDVEKRTNAILSASSALSVLSASQIRIRRNHVRIH